MSDRIRFTISVTPEVHAIFTRMAEAAGMSLGKTVGDWLADTAEGAQFVAQKVVEARRAPRVVMREMQAFSRGLVDEVDDMLEQMRCEPAGGKRSAPAGSGAGKPPSSLTGVNTPPRSRKGAR